VAASFEGDLIDKDNGQRIISELALYVVIQAGKHKPGYEAISEGGILRDDLGSG
jgi:hypothetical protein